MNKLPRLLLALVAASLWGAAAFAAERTIELPVLVNPKAVNEVITEEDLIIKEFSTKKVRGDMIRDSQQIIGQAARRQLQAGRPLRLIDIRKEYLVQRGDRVMINFQDGALIITATGEAKESGAMGDIIRVKNAGTDREIDATVSASKTVTINR